jgi:fimbrial chaperone protein
MIRDDPMTTRTVMFSMVPRFAATAIFALGLLGRPGAVQAGFRVAPIRVDLERASPSGAVTVTNDDAGPLTLQMKALEWSQDADGKDHYAETTGLVFFPKVVTLEKSSEQVIRIGTKLPPAERERCFRLYISQTPTTQRGEASKVNILVSIGVPVFVRAAGERSATVVAETTAGGGELQVMVRNAGNEHFKIEKFTVSGVDAQGAEIFSRELPGRYLHGGASRRYVEQIPAEICPKLAKARISIKTDRSTFEGNTVLGEESCRP